MHSGCTARGLNRNARTGGEVTVADTDMVSSVEQS